MQRSRFMKTLELSLGSAVFNTMLPMFSQRGLSQIGLPMIVLEAACHEDSKTNPNCHIWWSFGWTIVSSVLESSWQADSLTFWIWWKFEVVMAKLQTDNFFCGHGVVWINIVNFLWWLFVLSNKTNVQNICQQH